jgi:hypothetical protein
MKGKDLTSLDYSFFGVPCAYPQFAVWVSLKNVGQCPFCSRTGLKKNFGSDRKHIRACARKAHKIVENNS